MSTDDWVDKTRTNVALTAGTMVSHYRIIDKIGAGGMGEVFLAEDTRLKRKVALKFLPSHLVSNEEIKTRFLREAQAVAKLNHPNIVTIYDVSEFNGRPFFAMEHVEGHLLHHFAHEKPLPLDTVVDYAMQVCQGIGEAHRAGVIHRDIKATNIIVDTKGRARLLDFGLAAVSGDDKLTKTGSTLGTVSYMSPEQVSGREIDQRSDLFSFGVVLYELLAGRTPFRRDNEGATLRAIMQDIPEPLGRYKSDIPQKFQQIIDKLLEKDRQMRYQTAEDIIADLKRLVYDSQQTGNQSSSKPVKSHLKVYAGAAIVVMAATLAFFFLPRSKSTQSGTTNAVLMIAVLPFENLGNPDDEYFADGMTEEITSRLVGIAGLGVISRTSAMQYKGMDRSLSQIGKELGVSYVLEGSIRWTKIGERSRVRITPRLIRVSDNRNMWADNYEREVMEVFAVQEDIATKIASQLDLVLLDSDRKELAARPTSDSRAYDYYLKGINELRKTTGSMFIAAANLDSAVMLDSSFALAHAARSRAYTLIAWKDPDGSNAAIARRSFEKALQLQPDLSYGRMAAGIYYNYVEEDYDKSLVAFNLAVSELHSDAELLTNIALVQWRKGMISEAGDNFYKACELDPLNPAVHDWRSGFLVFTGMYAEAEQSINRAIALDSKNPGYYAGKIGLYVTGYADWDKNRAVVSEALKHIDTATLVLALIPGLTSEPGLSADSLLGFSPDHYARIADSVHLLFDKMADSIRMMQSQAPETVELGESWSYWALSRLYRAAGNATLATEFLDSAKTVLRSYLGKVPTDFHAVSQMGLLLAESNSCDQAVQYGIRGKELLSIDECHW